MSVGPAGDLHGAASNALGARRVLAGQKLQKLVRKGIPAVEFSLKRKVADLILNRSLIRLYGAAIPMGEPIPRQLVSNFL